MNPKPASTPSAARSQPEGERKLVTVLFTDIVGSTTLAEQLDPEDWAEIVAGMHEWVSEAITRYGGLIAQLLGDGALAFFGAPVAHEDDPERAVYAAIDVLTSIKDYARELRAAGRVSNFEMRVGLNTGLVVVGNIGAGQHVEYLAVGDTVNLAARMQSAAAPDTICIADNTARAVRHAFDLESLGLLEVKGKSEPVPAFRVIGLKAVAESKRGIVGLDSPIVGREREIDLLHDRIAALLEGQGGIVSVVGDAGLGKSRLVKEIVLRAPFDFDRYEGRSLSYVNTPNAAMVDLLTHMLDLRAGDGNDVRLAKIKPVAGELTPFIATLLGVQLSGGDLDRVRYLEPPQMRESIFESVVQLIEQRANAKPLALVFEDLHWADTNSLDLIERMMLVVSRAPLLLIGVFRPGMDEPSWRFHQAAQSQFADRYTPIELAPLNEDQSRQLVGNLLHIEDLPESVRMQILAKAEGNPFFVEEVIRSLLDSGLVVRQGEHWRATKDIVNITLPDTLAGVITARLDRLDEDSKRTAQTAAVIGREFPFDVLADVMGMREGLEMKLDTLTRRELVLPKREAGRAMFIFKHVLTQEAAYNSLLMSKRRAIHRQVAECLEKMDATPASEVARHFVAAQEPERALPYLVEAADQAAAAYAMPEAIRLYTQALAIAKEKIKLPLARRAFEGLGLARFSTGDLPGAIAVYKEMEEFAVGFHDVPMRISALNKMSRPLVFIGELEPASAALNASERLAAQNNDKAGMAEHHLMRCVIGTAMADFEKVAGHLGSLIESGRDLKRDYEIAFGLVHSAATWCYLVRLDKAEAAEAEAREFTLAHGDVGHYAETLVEPTAIVRLAHGDVDGAVRAIQEGLDISARIGYAVADATGSMYLAWLLRCRGEYEQAEAMAQRCMHSGQRSGYPFFAPLAIASEGASLLDVSPALFNRARPLLEQARHMLENPLMAMFGTVSWNDLAECALALGNTDDAREFIEQALNHPTALVKLFRPRTLLNKTELCLITGDVESAQESVNAAHNMAHEKGMTWFFPMIEYALGRVSAARNHDERALRHFMRADELGVPMTFRPTVWRARDCAADALSRLGRERDAEHVRGAALAMAEEIAAQFDSPELRDTFFERVDRAHNRT